MKAPLITLLALAAIAQAETLKVYRQKSTPTPEKMRSKLTGEPSRWISPGEPLGEIELGDATLEGIVAKYRKESWKSEPFYGPVETYVFEDAKGRFYVAHFEFVKGDKAFGEGSRVAINRLEKAGKKGMFLGSPYDGSSVTEELLLKRLRAIASK